MIDLSSLSRILGIIAGALLIVYGIVLTVRLHSLREEFKLVITAHKRIFSMAWIIHAVFYCFTGMMILVSAFAFSFVNYILFLRVCAGMLFLVAFIITATGAQSEKIVIRAGPIVMIAIAFTLLAAGMLPND